MGRDHTKLRVFALADVLVIDVYRLAGFPPEERYGLQSQLRRATVSTATNIVEGCARKTSRDYVHFLTIALGSASEARYLMEVSYRLGFVSKTAQDVLAPKNSALVKSLQSMLNALGNLRE
jgi:four helix bundle protein